MTKRQQAHKENYDFDNNFEDEQEVSEIVKAASFDSFTHPSIFDTKISPKLEEAKQKLCEREDYNIFEIYKMYFDTECKGIITQDTFESAMQQLGVTKVIELEKPLQYSDFCDMMLPKAKCYANLAVNRTPVYTNYFGQHNNTDNRAYKQLIGYTHQQLKGKV